MPRHANSKVPTTNMDKKDKDKDESSSSTAKARSEIQKRKEEAEQKIAMSANYGDLYVRLLPMPTEVWDQIYSAGRMIFFLVNIWWQLVVACYKLVRYIVRNA